MSNPAAGAKTGHAIAAAILAVIGILIIRKYPIDQPMRQDIQKFISEHQTKKEVD